MKKSVFAIFAILLLIMPLALAVEVNVKTLGGLKVIVFLREPGTQNVLEIMQGKAEDGTLTLTSDFARANVDLQANVINSNGDYIVTFKKPGVNAMGIIDLYLPSDNGATVSTSALPVEEEDVVEETEEVVDEEVVEDTETEEEVTAEDEEVSAGITGNAVENIKGVLGSKTSYYILGAIIGLFALVFIIQIGRNKIGGGSENYKVVKLGSGDEDRRIRDAERKIIEAKNELDDIKDRKRKLAEAKARFQKDKDELSRLE